MCNYSVLIKSYVGQPPPASGGPGVCKLTSSCQSAGKLGARKLELVGNWPGREVKGFITIGC